MKVAAATFLVAGGNSRPPPSDDSHAVHTSSYTVSAQASQTQYVSDRSKLVIIKVKTG